MCSDKIQEISEPAPSDWREHAKWRQENRYWTRFSGFLAMYLFVNKGGTCGVHQYIKDRLNCDDTTVRKICKGDYDFKLSEILKLITPEEFANTIIKTDEYLKRQDK